MNIVEELQQAIGKAAGVEASSVHLEHPQDLSHGDFATNIAMVLAKERGKNPKQLAEEIIAKTNHEAIASISVAGPGFINISLTREFFLNAAQEITSQGKNWGKNTTGAGKRVIVEYTDPNPFKQMHIGHFMSNAIGEAMARLVRFSGAEVRQVTYQGDVGPHVAKALYGMQHMEEAVTPESIGKAYALGAKAYEEDENAKEEIDTLNQEIYKGLSGDMKELYDKGRKVSLEAFEEMYHILGSNFDHNFFESESTPLGLELVEKGLQEGVFEESEGAVVYKGEDEGLHTRVFRTSRGTPTYETKDLGLQPLKEKWWEHDESIIITAQEQASYFKVMLAAMQKLNPESAAKIQHIPHGFMKLPEGKMSSRSGNVVLAKELVEEVIEQAKTQNESEEVAQDVAVGALKYMVLRQQPGADIIFDKERMLSLEGDSGPYVQYALVRAKKLLSDAKTEGETTDAPTQPYELERILYRFPEVVARAQERKEPHHITQYVTELAAHFNRFYANEKILGGDHEAFKLLLVSATMHTIENALWLLAIPTPERM